MNQQKSKWQGIYELHQRLERKFRARSPEKQSPDKCVLRRLADGPRLERLKAIFQETLSYGLGSLDPELTNAAAGLAEAFATCRSQGWPYEDVYQAALWIAGSGQYSPENAYRGQRLRSWRPVASFHRSDVSDDDRLRYRRMLTAFVDDLRSSFLDTWGEPRFSREECMAIAQHCSRETGIKTWMLDLTTDPFVAFFFATYESEKCCSHDIGCVMQVSPKYWRETLDCNGILGHPRLIQPQRVARIQAQRAGFLPELYPGPIEQNVPLETSFYQVPGLVFEDPHRGIARQTLLVDDEISEFACTWGQQIKHQERIIRLGDFSVPAGRSLPPLGDPLPFEPPRYGEDPTDFYYQLASCWFNRMRENRSVHKPQEHSIQQAVRGLAALHAGLQDSWRDVPRTVRSFNQLGTGVDQLFLYLRDGSALPSNPVDTAAFLGELYWRGAMDQSGTAVLHEYTNTNAEKSLDLEGACRELANLVAARGKDL